MDIFLYNKPKGDFIKFPIIPLEVETGRIQDIETFKTLTKGNIKLIGDVQERILTIESFFPVNDYAFSRDKTYKGMEYINKIETWRNTKESMYVVISDLNIAMECVITDLQYKIKDGSGDIYYTLNIEESIRPTIKKTEPKKQAIKTVKQDVVKTLPSSYGIVTADVLNVRNGNGTNYSVIGSLAQGTKVKLYRLEANGKWWHIYFGNHGGHVASQYIKRV